MYRSCSLAVIVASLICSLAASAEEVTPIGTILLNPTSYHRRPVMIQGIAKDVAAYDGKDFLNQPQCSQGFTVDDGTGAITVVSMSKCHAGEEHAVMVTEGEPVLVNATIEAPPTNFKDAKGASFDFKALATKIMRLKQ